MGVRLVFYLQVSKQCPIMPPRRKGVGASSNKALALSICVLFVSNKNALHHNRLSSSKLVKMVSSDFPLVPQVEAEDAQQKSHLVLLALKAALFLGPVQLKQYFFLHQKSPLLNPGNVPTVRSLVQSFFTVGFALLTGIRR